LNRLLGPIRAISHLGAHCVRFLRFALVSDHHHRPPRQKSCPVFSTPTSGHLASSRVGGGARIPAVRPTLSRPCEPTHGDSMTCTATCGNGAWTGIRTTMGDWEHRIGPPPNPGRW